MNERECVYVCVFVFVCVRERREREWWRKKKWRKVENRGYLDFLSKNYYKIKFNEKYY